jgi:hypothetical protein
MTEDQIQQKQRTREEVKLEKKQQDETSKRSSSFVRVRLIPIWLRLLLVTSILVISLLLGAIIGYGVIGDGKPLDALKISTWTHIRDMVDKK